MTILSIGAIIAMWVTLIKPFIELKITDKNQLHDTVIQLFALVSGIIGQLLYVYTTQGVKTGADFWSNAGTGAAAGLSAIVLYHVVTGSFNSVLGQIGTTTTTTTIVPEPASTTTVVTPTARPMPADTRVVLTPPRA